MATADDQRSGPGRKVLTLSPRDPARPPARPSAPAVPFPTAPALGPCSTCRPSHPFQAVNFVPLPTASIDSAAPPIWPRYPLRRLVPAQRCNLPWRSIARSTAESSSLLLPPRPRQRTLDHRPKPGTASVTDGPDTWQQCSMTSPARESLRTGAETGFRPPRTCWNRWIDWHGSPPPGAGGADFLPSSSRKRLFMLPTRHGTGRAPAGGGSPASPTRRAFPVAALLRSKAASPGASRRVGRFAVRPDRPARRACTRRTSPCPAADGPRRPRTRAQPRRRTCALSAS